MNILKKASILAASVLFFSLTIFSANAYAADYTIVPMILFIRLAGCLRHRSAA